MSFRKGGRKLKVKKYSKNQYVEEERLFDTQDYFNLITEYRKISPNTGKYGPDKTPYLNTFLAVNSFWFLIKMWFIS